MKGLALAAALAAAWLVACSRTESVPAPGLAAPAPQAVAVPAPPAVFPNLRALEGKPPPDLMQQPAVAAELRRIVPQPMFKCLDNSMDAMHDLERDASGTLSALLNGSHAHQFMEGYLRVEPSGALDVVLQCDPMGTPKEPYQYFTNRAREAAVPTALLDWLHVVGQPGDRIVKTAGSVRSESEFAAFLDASRAGSTSGQASGGNLASSAAAPAVESAHPVGTRGAVQLPAASSAAAGRSASADGANANRTIIKAAAEVLVRASIANQSRIPEIDGLVRACNAAYDKVPAEQRASDDPRTLREVASTCYTAAAGICSTFKLYGELPQCGALETLPRIH